MKVTCGWCQQPMGQAEPITDTRVSHGICPACFDEQMRGLEVPASEEVSAALRGLDDWAKSRSAG